MTESSEPHFPTETTNLAEATAPASIRLRDGDHLDLEITPVRKRIRDAEVRMLAYNGSIPGPVLLVGQGSEIEVTAVNRGDVETTVHWHGLRLDNASDGVPGDTQPPIGIGEEFTCRVRFPDPGIYWYHPHVREDFAQEMGLYGTIVVAPADETYWAPADRELTLTLDDVLIEDGRIAGFRRSGPTHTAMGRYGNVMLINGETDFAAEVGAGEVLRLHLVNTANTRIFNVGIDGARMKLVGGDSGRVEREELVEAVLLSPSERATVDVLFERAGEARLEHRPPDRAHALGAFMVSGPRAKTAAAEAFGKLRVDPELEAIRGAIEAEVEREPDKTLSIASEMPILYGGDPGGASTYICPMHPEVVASQPETCPKCGMKLVPEEQVQASADEHPHGGDHGEHAHGHHDNGDGLEWEDLMPEINRRTDPTNMHWKLVDEASGSQNDEISWSLRVGDRVKIRLANGMDQDHPMHHPFHIHGAGRFLILARDGEVESNLVWKDTVLVRAGETVDILLEVTNPGRWMAHCHIAEHTESGMMFTFEVAP